MKVIRKDQVPKQLSTNPLFTGGSVEVQRWVPKEMGKNFGIVTVYFSKGARTKFHKHTSDQVLMVTSGRGIVTTEQEQLFVGTGDVIHIPAGEKHWHGAANDSEFAHISVVTADSQETTLEN